MWPLAYYFDVVSSRRLLPGGLLVLQELTQHGILKMSLKLEIDFVAKESHSGYPVEAEACCCSVETVMKAAQEDLPGKVGEGEEVYCKELVD